MKDTHTNTHTHKRDFALSHGKSVFVPQFTENLGFGGSDENEEETQE